jgi:spore germination protein YaaH
MAGRSRGRFLAPIALAATIAGTYVIVHQGLAHKHHAATPHTATNSQTRHQVTGARFYNVRPGDSLTSIAGKTGISIATIRNLNPRIDPNSLQPGQRLRLRR